MDNEELSKRNKLKIIVVTTLIFLVAIAGISYAYFSIQIVGNDTASSMRLTTANMSLVYTDIEIRSGENVIPGWSSQSKTITVYNDGNTTAYYNIIWRDLLNEIINNELVISGSCTSDVSGNTCSNISETVIPTATTLSHNIAIKNNIEIEVGETHTYTVTVLFKETGSNQNYNQNKEFYGTINISEGLGALKRAGTDSTTGLPVVKMGSEEFYDITNAINYTNLINSNGNIYNYASDKSILLAKYNLLVGRTYANSTYTEIASSTTGYGLQSSDAKGYVDSSTPAVGVVPFSGSSDSNGYWYDTTTSTIKTQYGTSYNASNIYDTTYNTAPNWSVAFTNNAGNANYSIAYYVEEYMNTLGIEGTGRLLTYTEANAMTQAQRTNGARFWLGSAYSSNLVWYVNSAGGLSGSGSDFAVGSRYGVRPVIVISTSDISA